MSDTNERGDYISTRARAEQGGRTTGSKPRSDVPTVMSRWPVVPDSEPVRLTTSGSRCSHGSTGVNVADGVLGGVNDGVLVLLAVDVAVLVVLAVDDAVLVPVHHQVTTWAAKRTIDYVGRTDERTYAHAFFPKR